MTDEEAIAQAAALARKRLRIEKDSTPDFFGEVAIRIQLQRGTVVAVRVEGAQQVK